jgi:hypothetical protein
MFNENSPKTKQQMFDHWYIQGRSIEDSDVAIIAVLGEESLEEVVML